MIDRIMKINESLIEYLADSNKKLSEANRCLAECYRLTGTDPDGNEDWRLAPSAVDEVKRLREESDEDSRCHLADLEELENIFDLSNSGSIGSQVMGAARNIVAERNQLIQKVEELESDYDRRTDILNNHIAREAELQAEVRRTCLNLVVKHVAHQLDRERLMAAILASGGETE